MQARRNTLLGASLCTALLAPIAIGQDRPPAATQAREGEIREAAAGDRSSRLSLKLKERDLREVVASIARRASVNIIIDPAIEKNVTIDLQDVPWRQALSLVAEQVGCIVTDLQGGVFRVEEPPKVSFVFPNTDIQMVIDTIAKVSGANIIVAPEVKGNITLRLRDVPWRDALDAAAKTLGFVVVQEDRGILRVVPKANIQLDLESATIQLRYVRPKSFYLPFIKSEYIQNRRTQVQLQRGEIDFTLIQTLEGMLTPNVGQLRYLEEVNAIMVKDTRPVVEEIRRVISMIDVEPAQIFMDVKFVTTTNEDILSIGISPGGNGWTASLGLGQIPSRLPFNLGAGGWDDKIIVDNNGVGPFADVNAGTTVVPPVVFGALDMQQVTATLRLLKRDSRSEILQAPKIVALDHQPATIFVGEAVRYAQARVEQGQAGGLLLALEEGDESPVNVGFQLLATPHVVPGSDRVILEVIPQRTALTGTGNTALAPAGFDVFRLGSAGEEGQIALPRVASSTLSTTVLLRSGQTAVLGGLVTRNQTDTETKLPLLGDIPVLGYLFKEKSTQDSRTTLIVFITPSLIRSPEDTAATMQRVLEERLRDRRSLMQQQDAIFGRGDGDK